MEVLETKLDGIALLAPKVFGDSRGFFMESYNAKKLAEIGITSTFVQDNHSRSAKGVLRGLHYQLPPMAQAKLVRVVDGEVFDVVVDIRQGSPTFGQWEGFILSAENKRQLFVPPGFAHGFLTLSDTVDFLYKCGEYYSPQDERGIIWNDKDIGIDWPLDGDPVLSERDTALPGFKNAEYFGPAK